MVDMLEEEKASKVIFGLVFQPILNQQYITTICYQLILLPRTIEILRIWQK